MFFYASCLEQRKRNIRIRNTTTACVIALRSLTLTKYGSFPGQHSADLVVQFTENALRIYIIEHTNAIVTD